MKLYKNRKFQTSVAMAILLFAVMISLRIGWLSAPDSGRGTLAGSAAVEEPAAGETWMKIIQNGRQIGYTHRRLATVDDGYRINEKMVMVLNTMGLAQEVVVETACNTALDFSVDTFTFSMVSGSFQFAVGGRVRDNVLSIHTKAVGEGADADTGTGNGGDDAVSLDIPLENRLYLTNGILPATVSSGLKPGEEMTLFLFDPSTMGQAPATVRMEEREFLVMEGRKIPARRITLSFKGADQTAWVNDAGQVIREEGLLGIVLEKATREVALGAMDPSGAGDLTAQVSIPSTVKFQNPEKLVELQLQVSGVDMKTLAAGVKGASRFRQRYSDGVITIQKESLDDLPATDVAGEVPAVDARLLLPGPFVQSDNEKIQRLARRLAVPGNPLETVRQLVAWIQKNIERQPVISLPNALSTLEQRRGDCNEHAALMTALCRAANIPADMAAGLVYLDGAFYYHAWNRVFIGKWITVDALFNQIPADVTHITLTGGSSSSQLDLMGVIGKIDLAVLRYK